MFNIESPQQLAALLYGGTLKEESEEICVDTEGNPIIYKSGQRKGEIKTRKCEIERTIKGLGIKPLKKWQTPSGANGTGEEVLKDILRTTDNEDAKIIIEKVLRLRELNKLLKTYYKGVSELVYDEDSCVHPNFMHVKTETGRLSSSNPNIQNVPSGIVKEHFVSRFDNGKLIQVDVSQLEICIQAQLSGDKKYIKDIQDGVDQHCKRLSLKEKIPYDIVFKNCKIDVLPEWEKKRSKIKQFSFQRAYGAGAYHIAEATGMSVEEIQDLIKAEEEEYSRLKLYNTYLKSQVDLTSNGKDTGHYFSPLNRKFVFTKQDAPKWLKEKGVDKSFKPTEIQNYMIQGTGFDIVAMFLGRLFREAIKHREKFLLINTVHDSVLIDCKEEYVELACKVVDDVLYSLNQYLKEKHKFQIDIKVDKKIGNNWSEV